MSIIHPFTEEEIKYMQRHLGVKADGDVGSKTLTAMRISLNSRKEPLKLLVSYAQTLINAYGGVTDIKVDGYFGPVTDARMSALVRTKPKTVERPQTGKGAFGSEIVKPVRPNWTSELPIHTTAALTSYFGKPGENLVRMKFPYQMYYGKQKVSSTMVHAKAHDAFLRLFTLIAEIYSATDIVRLGLDQYSGCFNHRPVRGGRRLSTHSWGISMDLCAADNRLKTPFAKARFSGAEYQAFWGAVYICGFKSGGLEWNRDAMHIEYTK